MLNYRGRWRVTVIGKDSSWDQRVVISGATTGGGIITGVIGAAQLVDGAMWSLNIEHNDGTGWSVNDVVAPDAMIESGANLSQVVRSKDQTRPGDPVPNDLILRVEKIGPMFDLSVRPYAVDAATLAMLPDGIFVGLNGVQMMGVEIRNTWGRAFHADSLLEISALGRATLASFGVIVRDGWSPQMLAATQQTQLGGSMRLPPLEVGERFTLFFLLDAANAHRGKPPVEFVLHRAAGDPDPNNSMRFNRRAIFIIELSFDGAAAEGVALLPEGRLSMKLKSVAVSPGVVQQLCHRMLKRGRGKNGGRLIDDLRQFIGSSDQARGCDPKMLREIVALLCNCLTGKSGDSCCSGCGDGGDGLVQRCLGGAVWLPLKFDYSVEITGGFAGQHGPLAFQDPWWKVVLLALALLAWLVGFIAQIAGDAGYGVFATDKPKKIGVVGASSLNNVDTALIELDGSRPFRQSVADALTGETNVTPILGMDTVVDIDPTVALPFLGMLVYKSGARTGLTHGIVTAPNAPVTICRGELSGGVCTPNPAHPDQNLTGQIVIAKDPAFPEEQFSDHGDSGSLILSREPASANQVVGLLYGGSDTSTDASPIQDVLNELQLKLRP